jgi:hypothetical protein
MMASTPQHTPGRNELCWCGSGNKYKACHLADDEAKEHERRETERAEAERDQHASHRCEMYSPRTHKIPAVDRPDFQIAVRNLSAAGEGAWLHVESPVDLGRDQASVDAAIGLLDGKGVLLDFRQDPSPPVIAGTQDILDRMAGRGVFTVVASGRRLRRYGRCEVVPDTEGNGYRAFVSGRGSMRGVVQVLVDAAALDGASLGVEGGLLAHVWPVARVVREVVRNRLGLPASLSDHAVELAAALVERVSQTADDLDGHAMTPDVVRAQATLPYLVGLREALADPLGQLEGMGLEPAIVKTLSVQLESAKSGPRWLLRLADFAGDDWDTPEGYWTWVNRARSIAEIADVLDMLVAEPESGPDNLATTNGPAESESTERDEFVTPVVGSGQATPEARNLVMVGPSVSALDLFAEVDAAAERHASDRAVLHDRLAQILDEKERLDGERLGLAEKLHQLDAEDQRVAELQAIATSELDASAESEIRARQEILMTILARGAVNLDEAGRAWSQALASKAEQNDTRLLQAERTVREYEDMERRNVTDQIPVGLRASLMQEVEQARASLRAALGGRDPITVPAVVAASDDDSCLVLSVGLPLAGFDELKPGALHTAVAAAAADAIAEVARSMTQIDVVAVEHERCKMGGSVLRIRFSGPPPVTAEECAQYCAALLEDCDDRSAQLRAGGVAIQPRVVPDLDTEALDV